MGLLPIIKYIYVGPHLTSYLRQAGVVFLRLLFVVTPFVYFHFFDPGLKGSPGIELFKSVGRDSFHALQLVFAMMLIHGLCLFLDRPSVVKESAIG